MENLYLKFKEKFPSHTEALCRAVVQNKFAHAYIVYSDVPEVRGEYSVFLAQLAACPNLSSEGVPCFSCSVCRQISEGSYAELFTLMPVSKSRKILIGKDEKDADTMRWFQSQFYMSSFSPGRNKVGIITDADCLNIQAQNSFLKTLEEPPKDSIFILNTGSPFLLLPTMISRCHIVSLLENYCNYPLKNEREVIMALMHLQSCDHLDLNVSKETADRLVEVAAGLKSEAEERVLPQWRKRLDDAENPDLQMSKGVQKRIKDYYAAAVHSEYLRLREYFLSLLHTFFAQNYQLACGAELANLANPEIYNHIDIKHIHFSEEDTYKALSKVEKLQENLRFNVSEDLAIREFCYSFKGG